MRARRWVTVALLATMTSCFTIPPGTTLQAPPAGIAPSTAVAWLDEVIVSDPKIVKRQNVGEALTVSLRDFIEQGRYFRAVRAMPGHPAAGEYVLRFEFDRLSQERHLHPLYIPGAFLTLTLYIWVNGPIVIDELHLHGTLTVTRPDGTVVVRRTAARDDRDWKGLYSSGYMTADRTDERTALVTELLNGAVAELDKGGSQ